MRLRHVMLLLVAVASFQISGCAAQSQSVDASASPTWVGRLFPRNPDDAFVGDEARSIDSRLSNKRPRVDF